MCRRNCEPFFPMNLRSSLRKILRSFGYDAVDTRRFDRAMGATSSWPTHRRLLDHLLREVAKNSDDFALLQIGANDGIKDNISSVALQLPSARLGLVEPNPYCVAQLESGVARDRKNVTILPVAFAAEKGNAKFYVFDKAFEKGIQLDVFSSFQPELLYKQKRYFHLESEVVRLDVECETLAGITRRCDIKRWDVIISDIEGFDHEVVRQVCDGQTLPPALMVFEHEWLSPEQRKECYENLAASGYALIAGAHDTIAWHMTT